MNMWDIDWYNINKHVDILTLPNERWVNMCDFLCGTFSISSYGRVRRDCHVSGERYVPTRVLKLGDNGNGYIKATITKSSRTEGKKCINRYVHRLVAKYFIPNPYKLPQVNHKSCGLGKFDNRVEMLEWVSASGNIRDAHRNGLMKNRAKVGNKLVILPDEKVAEVYREYKDTGKISEVARNHSIPRTTLSSIINKRSRAKITDEIDLQYNNKNKTKNY